MACLLGRLAILCVDDMSGGGAAYAFTQGLLDAIRKTDLVSSLWEVWSLGTHLLRTGGSDLATDPSSASKRYEVSVSEGNYGFAFLNNSPSSAGKPITAANQLPDSSAAGGTRAAHRAEKFICRSYFMTEEENAASRRATASLARRAESAACDAPSLARCAAA